MELGVKEAGLSAVAVGIGGIMTGYGAGLYTLEEAMLVIIAISTTTNAVFNYFSKEME
jgi:hypothetical protein